MSNKKITKNLSIQENKGSISVYNGSTNDGFGIIHNPKQRYIPILHYFHKDVPSIGDIYIQIEFDFVANFTIRVGQFQSKMQIPSRKATLGKMFSHIDIIAKKNGLQLSQSRFINKKKDKSVKLAEVQYTKQCNLRQILDKMESTLDQFVKGVNNGTIKI